MHDLRHTVGTYAGQSGANAFLVRDLLRHKNLAMTGRYVNRADSPVRTLSDHVGRADSSGHGWTGTGCGCVVEGGERCLKEPLTPAPTLSGSDAGEPALAGLQELLRPRVIRVERIERRKWLAARRGGAPGEIFKQFRT